MRRFIIACAGLALALSTPARAGVSYKLTTLVIEGDEVPGVGFITSVDNIAVNNLGQWLVECDTDNPDTDADSVLLSNGALYLREGQPIDPPPATLGSFDSVTLNSGGNSGFNFFLENTGGLSNDSGVYYGQTLVIQEGDAVNLPEFSVGTLYIGFFDVKINDSNRLLITASIDDPEIPTTVDRAIITVDQDGTNGAVLAKEGDILPGQIDAVTDFLTGPHATDINTSGDVMYVADLAGDAAVDIAVYINQQLVAQEGSPAPIAGRNWATLGSAKVDLANTGNYLISGGLDGDAATNLVIADRTGKIAQEGDSPADIAPFMLTSFGSGPVSISDRDQVLWFGDWNDADTSIDTGLFMNQHLLIQEGVSVIDGRLVNTVRGIEDGYKMSPNGRFIIAELVVVHETLGLVDTAVLIEFCEGDVDFDGDVGQADLGILLSSYGLCPGQQGYDAAANLDSADPCITQADLGILLSRYGLPCP